MTTRIEVASTIADTRASVRLRKLTGLGFTLSNVFLVDVYTIGKKLPQTDLKKVAAALANPVTQTATFNKPVAPPDFTWAIEIGFLPGVTDNVANTTKEIIENLLRTQFKADEGVYTSQITFISGDITQKNATAIANTLYNPLIQRAHLKSAAQYKQDHGMDVIVPKVKLTDKPTADLVDLEVSDAKLTTIGKQGIANADGTRRGPLALDLVYMKSIRDYFRKQGRAPTDVELESIAQTWSEHCKHTIFADPMDELKDGLYKTYIKAATYEIRKRKSQISSSKFQINSKSKTRNSKLPNNQSRITNNDFCVSVFTDNSGAIEFDEKYLITDKVETHNTPSALDPFGGSITGIVGVNRDAIGFGLGAKPVINRYGFCFADPRIETPLYRDKTLKQKMLSPARIMAGVVDGVNAGGNQSGIPTPQGWLFFDQRYQGKPLVFVGTVGLIPKQSHGRLAHLKQAKPGDYIVMVGGRVGADGIHGATFASEALDQGSPATAVQIGDAITQKKLSDALVKEVRDLGLYNSITDNGAGGLSCSVAEMAKECGGCLVELDKVPLKYHGLAPWQIWVSESQERMTLAVPPKKWKHFSQLLQRRGVEATVIGTFNDSGRCTVEYQKKIIMDIEMEFLHDGLPPRDLKTKLPKVIFKEPTFKPPKNYTQTLLDLLARLNITSFEYISQQYDHEVQAGSVLKPLQGRGRVNAHATVVRPVLSSNRGVVISQGLYPNYSEIDAYQMAACSIDTAIRNVVAAGADINYLALLDNFCWCSSTEPERLGQLKQAAQACYDYSIAYGTPLISGKDSMFNDFKGYDQSGKPIKISVPPTLLISSIGVMLDSTTAISLDLKFPGDLIYILGETHPELGGSEYYAMNNTVGKSVPQVDAVRNKKLYEVYHTCALKGLIASGISLGRGGLGVALAKTALAGLLGVTTDLALISGTTKRPDHTLFSESQGRMLVSVAPKNQKVFEKLLRGVSFAQIGTVTDTNKITVRSGENKLIDVDIYTALESYKSTFKSY